MRLGVAASEWYSAGVVSKNLSPKKLSGDFLVTCLVQTGLEQLYLRL